MLDRVDAEGAYAVNFGMPVRENCTPGDEWRDSAADWVRRIVAAGPGRGPLDYVTEDFS